MLNLFSVNFNGLSLNGINYVNMLFLFIGNIRHFIEGEIN